MTDVKNVTGTAFVVAEFRARENAEPHPLYLDRIVPIFLDDRTKRAAEAIAADFAAAEVNVRLRTRYLDDKLDEQLANGCRQVVILGAGLDTRGVRKRADGVAYFEIDDPTAYTQPWKGELTMTRSGGPIYEFACHEANYSLTNMLRGFRAAERKPD